MRHQTSKAQCTEESPASSTLQKQKHMVGIHQCTLQRMNGGLSSTTSYGGVTGPYHKTSTRLVSPVRQQECMEESPARKNAKHKHTVGTHRCDAQSVSVRRSLRNERVVESPRTKQNKHQDNRSARRDLRHLLLLYECTEGSPASMM
jgi:hypothetical protein